MTTYYYLSHDSHDEPLVEFAFGADTPSGSLTEARTMLRQARKLGLVALTESQAEYNACVNCQSGHPDEDRRDGVVEHDLGHSWVMRSIDARRLQDAIRAELRR